MSEETRRNDLEKHTLLHDEIKHEWRSGSSAWRFVYFLVAFSLISTLGNVYAGMKYWETKKTPLSQFAGLERNSPTPWTFPEISLNDSAPSFWDDLHNGDGIVAFDQDFIQYHNLPLGAKFPWDHSKHLYLLNAFHNLHCLKRTRSYLLAAYHGDHLDEAELKHVLHCIESFRQDTMCDADDRPRYGGLVQGESGNGQTRLCRDFSGLRVWAKKHTACHKHDESLPTLQRYAYCPKGTSYMDKVREIFPNAVENDI